MSLLTIERPTSAASSNEQVSVQLLSPNCVKMIFKFVVFVFTAEKVWTAGRCKNLLIQRFQPFQT